MSGDCIILTYIVYEVRYDGVPVYIGSGLEDRYEHAKSGKSHSVELNKLFFTEPDKMSVVILREDLTKEESLALEKEFIEAYEPKFNIVHTKRHKESIVNGRKNKNRKKSFRATSG